MFYRIEGLSTEEALRSKERRLLLEDSIEIEKRKVEAEVILSVARKEYKSKKS